MLDEKAPLDETSLVPGEIYQFLPLDLALSQLKDMKDGAAYHPCIAEDIARFFPILWDNSTGFIVVDMTPGRNSRVMLLEFENPEGVRKAYASFKKFIRDVIRANRENDTLLCFQDD